MSTDITTQPMTAEQFRDFVHRPENANRWFELVRGEVIELPPPQKPHGFVCGNFTRILGNYTFASGRFYVTGNDSGVILKRGPDTVRGPDVALYNDANTFAELPPKYGETVPLLAVEVLSPDDRLGKVMRKVKDYLKSDVRLVWVVDPETRNVTVHRPGQEPAVVEDHEDLTGEDILPGFRCKVAEFFRLPGEKPTGA
jgi:Uma2 family endonuclease